MTILMPILVCLEIEKVEYHWSNLIKMKKNWHKINEKEEIFKDLLTACSLALS